MDAVSQEEFDLSENEETIDGSVGNKLSLYTKELGFGWNKWDNAAFRLPKDCSTIFVIHPNARLYRFWVKLIFLWSIFSTFTTPLEFGFFRGWPEQLANLDYMQIVFAADVIVCFFVAYRDVHTYKIVYDKKSIALRCAC